MALRDRIPEPLRPLAREVYRATKVLARRSRSVRVRLAALRRRPSRSTTEIGETPPVLIEHGLEQQRHRLEEIAANMKALTEDQFERDLEVARLRGQVGRLNVEYPMPDDLYARLQESLGPDPAIVRTRLHGYLTLIEDRLERSSVAIDLGCGRGDWLHLLQSIGLSPTGVDCNRISVSHCRQRGLNAIEDDLLHFLSGCKSESVDLVSLFHVVEHLNTRDLVLAIQQAFRVLRPGGHLLIETPDVRNLVTATQSFYWDPTHRRPVPIELLTFLLKDVGFGNFHFPGADTDSSGMASEYSVISRR